MRQRRGSTGEVLMPHEMGQDALDTALAAAAAHARVTSVLSATADIEVEELEQQRAVQVRGGRVLGQSLLSMLTVQGSVRL